MARSIVFSLAGLVGLMSLHACISPSQHRRVVEANKRLQEQRGALEKKYLEQEQATGRLRQDKVALGKRVQDADYVESQRQELAALIKRFKAGGAIEPGVSVVQTNEGTVVQVQGEVLFASGRADLTASGKATLARIVPHVKSHAIRVGGHTDADPIRRSKWSSNLHLSTARAINVAQFLIKTGLDESAVSVAGYGSSRPVAEGDPMATANKAKNRRVEILLLGSAPAANSK